MDVREKLVELLGKAKHEFWCSREKYNGTEFVASYIIAHGVTVQEWISVNDRLPEDNERVIAYRPNEPETSAYKYCVMWGWSVKSSLKHRGITNWMPLPQPPKGE